MKDHSISRPTRRSVSLQAIETCPEVFQFRHSDAYEHHVNDLVRVLQSTGKFDALTLWEDATTGTLVLIDGHHRLAAYRQIQWTKKVPVTVHRCTLDEARLLALEENTKTRLPLTNVERDNVAWRLVCLGETYSRRQIVKASGKSDGTVAKMRRLRKQLLDMPDADELPTCWAEALSVLKAQDSRDFTDDEREAWFDAEASALDDLIGKPLGDMAQRIPEAACSVVVDRLGQKGMSHLLEMHAAEFGYVWEEMGDEPF